MERKRNKRSSVAVLDIIDQPSASAQPPRNLTEADAVEIWVARWLRIRPKHLVARYGCDSRRLYEIWWGEKFPGSRAQAEKIFRERHPGLSERIAFGYRRIPASAGSAEKDSQLSLFK